MEKEILLVDDDPVIRLLVGDYLKACGYKIKEASGGVEALLKLREQLPSLMLLDLQMPDMSGIEVLKTISSTRNKGKIPVILLSANADVQSLAEEAGVKAALYLQKPFDMQDVSRAIDRCMAANRLTNS